MMLFTQHSTPVYTRNHPANPRKHLLHAFHTPTHVHAYECACRVFCFFYFLFTYVYTPRGMRGVSVYGAFKPVSGVNACGMLCKQEVRP